MTQGDYEQRKARQDAGEPTDEDLRLIKQYEREGYSCRGSNSAESPETTSTSSEPAGSEDSSTARTMEHPSKRAESKDSVTAASAEKSSGRTGTKS